MAGGGGTEPNLTPFIDLFSVLICFLLMTAAWIQLETMPSSVEKPKTSDASEPTPILEDEKKAKLAVSLFADRVVMKENEQETVIPNNALGIEEARVGAILTTWRAKFPEKKDISLNTEANVFYGDMIRMYDFLIISDWPEVGINPN